MAFLTTVVKILENGKFYSLCLKTHEDNSLFSKNPNFFTKTQTILIDRDVS